MTEQTNSPQTDSPATAVAGWFGGASRVLFVHAHPDDESIVTGGTLAALAEQGRQPGVVTLTRGEQGEVNPGPFQQLEGTPQLADHRVTEIAAALFMLGIDQHVFLGSAPARAAGQVERRYEDSGMQWATDGRAEASGNAGPGALTSAPAHEALADLLAVAAEWDAEAIVSYNSGGGYGHPDHVFAHKLSRAVAHGLDIPFWEILEAEPAPETSEQAATQVSAHEVTPWLERQVAALRAYGTQLTVDGDEIVHVGGQRQAITPHEYFKLLPALD